ncbi:hypothetical protein GCK72_004322 [Caenorhabditis remanei]|uniref:Uncharacterized protein n=1 Tax=Caenorhabditis remanei TaxID=31234 RepID=A0A6A5HAY8_CAERE|nr:hypothetical protein GCK72_004322 [Caenorhabditis remanei]KAF1764375.1 hypothetical protein GCK72_004322 [Caenorhabditis remanei]
MSETSRGNNIFLSTPYVFHRQLSDFLCLETRLNLRKCSKRCQSLVDNMPLTIEELDISVATWVKVLLIEAKLGIKNRYKYPEENSINSLRMKNLKKRAAAEAVRDLKIILCNPNLQIEKLYMDFGKGQLLFLQRFVSMLTSLPHQIRVQQVSLGAILSPADCGALLSRLKTKKLQLLGGILEDSLNELFEIEQIKHVPAITIRQRLSRFPFNLLSNTEEFVVFFENLSQTEFDRSIEHSLQRDNFKKGRIYLKKNEPWITEFLLKNQAVKSEDGKMIATLDGPKFKNTVEVEDFLIVLRRTI